MIAAARGYAIELIMPENATAERVQLMRAYGAEVILTPATRGMEGAIDLAHDKVASGGYLMLDQFGNPDNWRAHYETTGPEIWAQTDGRRARISCRAMGTTGTIMGVSRFLRSANPDSRSSAVSRPRARAFPASGAGRGVPAQDLRAGSRRSRSSTSRRSTPSATARRLARERGRLVGVSSGGAVWAARQRVRELAAARQGRHGGLHPLRPRRPLSVLQRVLRVRPA